MDGNGGFQPFFMQWFGSASNWKKLLEFQEWIFSPFNTDHCQTVPVGVQRPVQAAVEEAPVYHFTKVDLGCHFGRLKLIKG